MYPLRTFHKYKIPFPSASISTSRAAILQHLFRDSYIILPSVGRWICPTITAAMPPSRSRRPQAITDYQVYTYQVRGSYFCRFFYPPPPFLSPRSLLSLSRSHHGGHEVQHVRHDEESLGAQAQLVPAETDLGVARLGQAVRLVHRLRSVATTLERKKKHTHAHRHISRWAVARE